MSFKSGFVTIVGRPNVGKSTLMNAFLGQKIAIVSDKSQTTRNCIKGILTEPEYQLVFLDTPGIHRPKNKLGEYMMRSQREAQEGTDVIVAMVTADESFGPTDRSMLENLRGAECPVFIIINKIDAAGELLDSVRAAVAEYDYAAKTFEISALDKTGTDELLNAILDVVPEGQPYFPDDAVSDFPEKFLACEVIREQMLALLFDEVPHGVGVSVQEMKERPNGMLYIRADILCERKSHKSIIIGKGGTMLREIGTRARKELQELLEAPVYLELFVRVEEDWRNNDSDLKKLGYTE